MECHDVKSRDRASEPARRHTLRSLQLIMTSRFNLLKILDYFENANSTGRQNALCIASRLPTRDAMAAVLSPPRILPSGDAAITVEFSRTIDDDANRRVLALDQIVAAEALPAITETVPTYRSLLVHYDPLQIDFDTLGAKLTALAQQPLPDAKAMRRWRIPVAYGGDLGRGAERAVRATGV